MSTPGAYWSVVLSLVVGRGVLTPHARAETPNVIIILSDDQGYADVSYNP